MDLDFDDQPSDAAPAARAGAKFKPKGRPQPKKKQVPLSTSQTTLSTNVAKEKLSTQSEDPVSLDGSSAYPSNVSVSETIGHETESGTINQFTIGTISKENVSVGVSVLRACTNVNLEEKRCDDSIEAAPEFPDDPRTQDSSTFGDFVTHETDEVNNSQTQRMQIEEEESRWNMETLNIVQEEGITSAYEQLTGKLQPKPRLLDTVIEEPESHYSVDYTTGANHSEFMVNVESRNEFNTDTTSYTELQEEEHNIPEVLRETVPGGCEQEHHVVSPNTNNTIIGEEENCLGNTVEETLSGRESKKGKSKRARKRKTTSEEEPNKSIETPEKKKFKHSSRRQRNRTCKLVEKELLETPDEEIRSLPLRDMLRLVEYREWMEKKEAKGAPVVPPTQESNTNVSDNQYYSQGFDAEDEFGLEEGENQEIAVVKPDSPVNYQTYMNKTPRTRWSKEDTELFYEGIREFGSNLTMVQQLFPDRTRQQIKLKFKLEERRFPLKLNDALSNRSKHLVHYYNVLKKLQQEAAAAREGEEEEEEEEEERGEVETTTDAPENEEPAKSEETERAGDGVAGVKEPDGGDECDENEGDDDDDDDFWNSYKSDM